MLDLGIMFNKITKNQSNRKIGASKLDEWGQEIYALHEAGHSGKKIHNYLKHNNFKASTSCINRWISNHSEAP